MKLSIKGMAWAGGLTWGIGVFVVALANYFRPGYGRAFLAVVDSVYPGYHAASGLGSAFVALGYALLDGAVGSAFLTWLYNRFAGD